MGVVKLMRRRVPVTFGHVHSSSFRSFIAHCTPARFTSPRCFPLQLPAGNTKRRFPPGKRLHAFLQFPDLRCRFEPEEGPLRGMPGQCFPGEQTITVRDFARHHNGGCSSDPPHFLGYHPILFGKYECPKNKPFTGSDSLYFRNREPCRSFHGCPPGQRDKINILLRANQYRLKEPVNGFHQ